jgi:O-antigen ligase
VPARAARPFAVRLGELLLWLLVLLPPLFFWGQAKEGFRLPKLLLAEWLGLASLLFFAWKLRAVGRFGWRDLWGQPVVRALAPLLAVATATLATTRHPVHAREGLIELWIGAACLAGWSLALPAARLRRFLDGLLLPAFVLAGLAILQAHDLWEFFRFADRDERHRLGITSLAGNPLDLGAYLVLPCLVAQAALAGRRKHRVWWALALAVCLYALIATQGLTPIAAVVAASGVLWALILPRRRALLLLGAGSALAGILIVAVAPVRERVADKWRDVLSGNFNSLLTGRLDGWRAAGWMFRQRPLAGVGHGAYRASYAEARLALVEQGVEFYRSQQTPVFANAHNEYLEVAAQWGLPGIAALGWGLWVLAGQTARRGGSERRTGAKHGPGASAAARSDRALAWAGLAAAAVLALTYFPFRAAVVAYPLLLFLAWVFRRAAEEAPP